MKAWLIRRKKIELYGTLLAQLQLEEEYNYNILLHMTSESFEKILQLIKDDMPNKKTKFRELIPPRL